MGPTRRGVLAASGLVALGTGVPGLRRGLLRPAAAAAARTVTFDPFSLIINEKRLYHWCGEFHYWRLPSPDLWRDVLQKMRSAGFTATSIYFDWGYHSPAPGVYDFTGVRDVAKLLRIAREVGIYVVARPGPYINAETDSGGFPGWVDTQVGRSRSSAPDYLASALEWYSNINPLLAEHQITRGGPVILYQIENEYSQGNLDAAYMEALEAKASADGIVVPTFHNDSYVGGHWRPGTPGGTDLYAFDSYPQGFNASNPTVWHAVPDFSYVRAEYSPTNPLDLAEGQGGSFDPWGGAGFANCRLLTDANFNRVFYKNNIAAGLTMQSFYMVFGGTSWGWLPNAGNYTSYDYGAAITEGRQLTDKYSEDKKIGYFVHSVTPILVTEQLADVSSTNSAIRVRAMRNPQTLTTFLTILHQDTTSTSDDQLNFPLATPDGSYPSVPQVGALVINGRDAKLLVAHYRMDSQRLVYSTSEIMTHGHAVQHDAAVFYGRNGETGETVLRYAGEPTVSVLAGTVSSTFNAATGDLRLNYIHDGLALVSVAGAGTPLLLGIADDDTAATFWRFDVSGVPVLIQGPYLVRTVVISGATAAITGDATVSGPINILTIPAVQSVTWNGTAIPVTASSYGTLSGSIPGPTARFNPPAITGWKTQVETPERLPGYDDSTWTVASNTTTNNPSKPPAGEAVLYADDYGYHHGDIWYRGSFTGTGAETGIALAANSVYPGRVSAWINGTYAGDVFGTGSAETIVFPAGSIVADGTNVISVLVEDLGHEEDGSSNDANKQPRGLSSAALQGSGASITWKIQGNLGGEILADPVRGPYNNGGLYGERAGWYLPDFPDGNWAETSLPATSTAPGITWYRTTVDLAVPAGEDVSFALAITDQPSRDYHLRIFVNGWHMGLYVNNVGPQTEFVVPNGILDVNGTNTIAIAAWTFGDATGGLGAISLVVLGQVSGGVPVSLVHSPHYGKTTTLA